MVTNDGSGKAEGDEASELLCCVSMLSDTQFFFFWVFECVFECVARSCKK